MTLSLSDIQRKNALPDAECRYANCRILFTIMLSVIMLNAIMLSVVMLNAIMLSEVMLNVVMLSVVVPQVTVWNYFPLIAYA
jgi:hypothetical protein